MKKLKIFLNSLKIIMAVVFIAALSRCDITEPTAPRWDVALNVPIAKKNYTLYDILEKKSDEISHYTEGANKNLLYYTRVEPMDEIDINDKLNIDNFSKSASETIGTISVDADSVNANVGYQWVGAPVNPGESVVLPAQNDISFEIEFTSVDQFQSAKILSGLVDLYITNNLPSEASLTLNSIKIENATTNETIVSSNIPAVITPLETERIRNLNVVPGVVAKNRLKLTAHISTNGSNGQSIVLPQHSLGIKAVIRNVEVTEVWGKVPDQDPVVVMSTVSIDDDTGLKSKIQNVKLDQGSLDLTLTNNLDIDAIATFTVFNLKNSQGNTFSDARSIPRKQSVKIYSGLSLKDYSIISLNSTPTDQVSYQISFKPLSSNDYRNIKSTDDVKGSVVFSSLKVKEFTGQLKPTELEQTRSAVALDVKDLQNKLQFQELNLKNPIVELRLRPTAQVEFSINGRMEAKNSIGQKSVMTLSSRTLNKTLVTPTDTIITINPDSLSNFFKKFTKFPDSLIVYAGGVVNPNYKIVSVKSSDKLNAKSKIEFPFDLGISGGEMKDSLEVDLSKDDRNKIKDLSSFDASLKVLNGIPAQVSFVGKLYDEQNKFLMYFPPKYPDQDTLIAIKGAATDNNGNVSSKSDQTIKVKMLNGDPEKLSRAKYMKVTLKFGTSQSGNAPVKFKTDNAIDIIASGSINYKVKP